jgi:hypothetical protein
MAVCKTPTHPPTHPPWEHHLLWHLHIIALCIMCLMSFCKRQAKHSGPEVGSSASYSHVPRFKSVQILYILPDVFRHPLSVHTDFGILRQVIIY